jgi:hypothetical protein
MQTTARSGGPRRNAARESGRFAAHLAWVVVIGVVTWLTSYLTK